MVMFFCSNTDTSLDVITEFITVSRCLIYPGQVIYNTDAWVAKSSLFQKIHFLKVYLNDHFWIHINIIFLD